MVGVCVLWRDWPAGRVVRPFCPHRRRVGGPWPFPVALCRAFLRLLSGPGPSPFALLLLVRFPTRVAVTLLCFASPWARRVLGVGGFVPPFRVSSRPGWRWRRSSACWRAWGKEKEEEEERGASSPPPPPLSPGGVGGSVAAVVLACAP